MVGHEGSSAGSYLADPTSPIPSHCASIVATSTLRVIYYFVTPCEIYTTIKRKPCDIIFVQQKSRQKLRKFQPEEAPHDTKLFLYHISNFLTTLHNCLRDVEYSRCYLILSILDTVQYSTISLGRVAVGRRREGGIITGWNLSYHCMSSCTTTTFCCCQYTIWCLASIKFCTEALSVMTLNWWRLEHLNLTSLSEKRHHLLQIEWTFGLQRAGGARCGFLDS